MALTCSMQPVGLGIGWKFETSEGGSVTVSVVF